MKKLNPKRRVLSKVLDALLAAGYHVHIFDCDAPGHSVLGSRNKNILMLKKNYGSRNNLIVSKGRNGEGEGWVAIDFNNDIQNIIADGTSNLVSHLETAKVLAKTLSNKKGN